MAGQGWLRLCRCEGGDRCLSRSCAASGSRSFQAISSLTFCAFERHNSFFRGTLITISSRRKDFAVRGVAEWLASIGLEEHTELFTDNDIDLEVVRDLTDQDLREL